MAPIEGVLSKWLLPPSGDLESLFTFQSHADFLPLKADSPQKTEEYRALRLITKDLLVKM